MENIVQIESVVYTTLLSKRDVSRLLSGFVSIVRRTVGRWIDEHFVNEQSRDSTQTESVRWR